MKTVVTEPDAAELQESDRKRALDNIRDHRAVIVITVLGLVARVAWLLHAETVPVSDFNDYRKLAVGLIDYQQFGYPEPSAFFLPLHPTYLAFFAVVSRSDIWFGLAAVAVSSASIPLAYFAARRVVGSTRGALIAASLFAFFPTFVLFSPVLATEHLFVTLMLGAIVAVTRLADHPLRRAIVTGLLLGAAALTRGEAIFYIPAFLFFILAATGSVGLRKRTRTIAVVVAMVAVVLLPWYIRNAIVVDPDSGLSASAGLNFYFAHNDSGNYGDFIEGNPLYGLPNAEASALGWRLGIEHIVAHPLNLAKDIWVSTQRLFASPDYASFWSTQERVSGDSQFVQRTVEFSDSLTKLAAIATATLISFAALAMLIVRRWTRELAFLVLPLILSSWVLRTVIYWAKPRYAYFITTMLIFLAALVIDTLLKKRPTPDTQ